jgi:hypothetical protein
MLCSNYWPKVRVKYVFTLELTGNNPKHNMKLYYNTVSPNIFIWHDPDYGEQNKNKTEIFKDLIDNQKVFLTGRSDRGE